MNQKEVVDTLLEQAKIEPGFTELGNLNIFRVLFEIISIWLGNSLQSLV